MNPIGDKSDRDIAAAPSAPEVVVRLPAWRTECVWCGRLAGLPFVLLALTPALLWRAEIVVIGLTLTVLAAFTIHIPVVSVVYGLTTEEQPETPLPKRAYVWLLLLWALTDWGLCVLAR